MSLKNNIILVLLFLFSCEKNENKKTSDLSKIYEKNFYKNYDELNLLNNYLLENSLPNSYNIYRKQDTLKAKDTFILNKLIKLNLNSVSINGGLELEYECYRNNDSVFFYIYNPNAVYKDTYKMKFITLDSSWALKKVPYWDL